MDLELIDEMVARHTWDKKEIDENNEDIRTFLINEMKNILEIQIEIKEIKSHISKEVVDKELISKQLDNIMEMLIKQNNNSHYQLIRN